MSDEEDLFGIYVHAYPAFGANAFYRIDRMSQIWFWWFLGQEIMPELVIPDSFSTFHVQFTVGMAFEANFVRNVQFESEINEDISVVVTRPP